MSIPCPRCRAEVPLSIFDSLAVSLIGRAVAAECPACSLAFQVSVAMAESTGLSSIVRRGAFVTALAAVGATLFVAFYKGEGPRPS